MDDVDRLMMVIDLLREMSEEVLTKVQESVEIERAARQMKCASDCTEEPK